MARRQDDPQNCADSQFDYWTFPMSIATPKTRPKTTRLPPTNCCAGNPALL